MPHFHQSKRSTPTNAVRKIIVRDRSGFPYDLQQLVLNWAKPKRKADGSFPHPLKPDTYVFLQEEFTILENGEKLKDTFAAVANNWSVVESAFKLTFVNDRSNAQINQFIIESEKGATKLSIICNEAGALKLSEIIGSKTSITTTPNQSVMCCNEGFKIEEAILAVNSLVYIKREYRQLISKKFGLANLFYNESKHGNIATTLAKLKDFKHAYDYAFNEMIRTGGESRCMEMLAKNCSYAEKIIAQSIWSNPQAERQQPESKCKKNLITPVSPKWKKDGDIAKTYIVKLL